MLLEDWDSIQRDAFRERQVGQRVKEQKGQQKA